MREQDDEPPREAQVRPCEWPSDEFMVHAGFKDEFDAYIQNAGLEDFVSDKCRQYYHLTDSFVRRFEFSSKRNTHMFCLIFMMNHIPWTLRISILLAKSHNGAFLVSLTKLNTMISLLASLWEKLEISHKLP